MSALEPGRQLLSAVLRALSAAEDEGRITSRVAETRRRWATEHADENGVVAVPRGWSATDSPGTHGGDETTPSVVRQVATERTEGARGGLLRLAGAAVVVAGVLWAAWSSVPPGPPASGEIALGEIAWGVLLAGAVEAVVYGGLLWAAGTVVGQLDALLRKR